MRGARVVAAALTLAAVGADGAPRSVSVEDPCGDLVTVAPQPQEWDRNDLAGLTVEEVRGADGAVLGVDLHVDTCGDAAPASRFGEYVEVRWPLDDRCWASAAVGHDGNEVTPVGGLTFQFGAGPQRLAIRCADEVAPYDLVTTASDREVVPLADAAVTRHGTRTTISLRTAELGELARLVAAGVTIDRASAVSAAAYGSTVVFGASDLGSGNAGVVDWTARAPALALGG